MASQKISSFTGQTLLNNADQFTFVRNATNYKVSFSDLKADLGVTGSLSQVGDPLAAPVLEIESDGVYNIRNLEAGPGIIPSVSAQNGITIGTNFVSGAGGIPLIKDFSAEQLVFRAITAGNGIAVAATNGSIRISATESTGQNIVPVTSLSDLPNPIDGAIQLEDKTIYLFTAEVVDISPNRLVAGLDTSIKGSSVLSTTLSSTTSDSLIKGATSFEVVDITLICPNGVAIEYDSPIDNNGTLLVSKISITSCAEIMRLNNYNIITVSHLSCLLASTTGVTITGVNGFSIFDTILFAEFFGTGFDFSTSANVFVQLNDSVIGPAEAASIPFDGLTNSGNILPGGSGTLNVFNIFGAFTNGGNILSSDIRWKMSSSNIIPDSVNNGFVSMPSNATETSITSTNNPVKVAGAWVSIKASRFENDTTGKITYIGVQDITVLATVSCTCEKQDGGTDSYTMYVAVNGVVSPYMLAEFATDSSRNPQISFTGEIDLVTGDTLEVFIEGNTSTSNIIVTAANFTVKE